MAISSQDIFDRKYQQFGMSASQPRFKVDYVAAMNNVLQELAVDLDDDAESITDIDDSIDLENRCVPAIDCGLDVWLLRYGNKSGELNIATAIQTYDRARSILRGDIDAYESREATDGEVIGLMDE